MDVAVVILGDVGDVGVDAVALGYVPENGDEILDIELAGASVYWSDSGRLYGGRHGVPGSEVPRRVIYS